MKAKRIEKKSVQKPDLVVKARRQTSAGGEDHLGATEEQVGDRTGSGAGYDQKEKSKKKTAKGGVIT